MTEKERTTGFEPATPSLGSSYSTAELCPLILNLLILMKLHRNVFLIVPKLCHGDSQFSYQHLEVRSQNLIITRLSRFYNPISIR
jgi:hypothetical protein